jgi:hypothetical protein
MTALRLVEVAAGDRRPLPQAACGAWRAERLDLPTGVTLVEHQPHNRLYVIVGGELTATTHGRTTGRRRGRYGAGDMAGELDGTADGRPVAFTAVAPTTVMRISRTGVTAARPSAHPAASTIR